MHLLILLSCPVSVRLALHACRLPTASPLSAVEAWCLREVDR